MSFLKSVYLCLYRHASPPLPKKNPDLIKNCTPQIPEARWTSNTINWMLHFEFTLKRHGNSWRGRLTSKSLSIALQSCSLLHKDKGLGSWLKSLGKIKRIASSAVKLVYIYHLWSFHYVLGHTVTGQGQPEQACLRPACTEPVLDFV